MYKIDAHEDAIVSLACSLSYIISLGQDEKLRVWERFQGNLLNTISMNRTHSNLLMLTSSLIVVSRPGNNVLNFETHFVESNHILLYL